MNRTWSSKSVPPLLSDVAGQTIFSISSPSSTLTTQFPKSLIFRQKSVQKHVNNHCKQASQLEHLLQISSFITTNMKDCVFWTGELSLPNMSDLFCASNVCTMILHCQCRIRGKSSIIKIVIVKDYKVKQIWCMIHSLHGVLHLRISIINWF